jgi:putative transposase
VLTGRKYRLSLTPEQTRLVEEFGGICRAVWNTGLEQRREYRRRGAWMDFTPQAAELAEAKNEHEWLRSAPSHVLQQTLMDLDRACREHGTFKVRWRSARRREPFFRFPSGERIRVERVSRKWGRCVLPKLGWVRFRWSRDLDGAVRSATVRRDGVHWYISFLVQDGVATPEKHRSSSAVGVDRGVRAAVVVSDGTVRNRAFITPGERNRYRRLQRKLARQAGNSTNRKKTVAQMRCVKRRERNRRADFCAWTGNRLATRHGTVLLEDSRTQAMVRSARGTVDNPDSQVRQKAGLNRSILDKGWFMLELALRNVARYTGCRITKVPAPYTSQRCSTCRCVDPESRESQAVYRCTTCGYHGNADVNAAKNVLADGLSASACGDLQPLGGSVEQEPAGGREALPPTLSEGGSPVSAVSGRQDAPINVGPG